VLRELAREAPESIDDLLAIKGIGPAKAAKFGRVFLTALKG
jgi:predicted flap endonuclease-1-like 5' DNA nuclease